MAPIYSGPRRRGRPLCGAPGQGTRQSDLSTCTKPFVVSPQSCGGQMVFARIVACQCLRGSNKLSPRELKIATYVAQDLNNCAISQRTGMGHLTLKNCLSR